MKLLKKIFRNTDAPTKVIAKVEEEVQMGSMYLFLLLTATILSVFGIVTSNTAVVIGSMIIAPLSWPIMGLAVGIASEKNNIILKSVLSILLSTALVVGLSYVLSVGFLSSSLTLNNEILSRITPTLYDLIIALAVGLVAAVSLSWSKVSETVAGVAIASSLLPPLTVTGMGFALQNWEVVSGSFLLFATNMMSIIFAGLVLFLLQGYYKVTKEVHVGVITVSFGVTAMTLIALGVQLTVSLTNLIQERSLILESEQLLQSELAQISSQLVIDNSLIRKEKTGSGVIMHIRADVTSPQDISITLDEKNRLVDKLTSVVKYPINLDLRFLPSLKVVSQDVLNNDQRTRLITQVEDQVGKYFQILDSRINIDTVRVWMGEEDERARMIVIIKVPEDRTLTLEQTLQLKNSILPIVGKEIDIEVQVLKTYQLTEQQSPTEDEVVREYLIHETEVFVKRVSSAWQMKIEVLDVARIPSGYTMSVLIYTGNKVNLEEKLEFYKKTIVEGSNLLDKKTLEVELQVVGTSVFEL